MSRPNFIFLPAVMEEKIMVAISTLFFPFFPQCSVQLFYSRLFRKSDFFASSRFHDPLDPGFPDCG